MEIDERLGEPYVLKGFPTQDGRALHHGVGQKNAAILAGSPHKEEAWRFLEYLLGEHRDGRREISESFSSRRNLLDKMVDCYCLSREEADGILEFLGSLDFAPRSAREREILGIITEEMRSYQKGYKSMEEVATVIQNRAEVLLQEHRR